MKMYFDEEDFLELEDYPHLYSKISVNENCLPCVLCEKVCPQEAIRLNLEIPKKKEIAPLKEGVEGSIKIDMDKCNFCGICAGFCEAFILIEREFTSEDLEPFEDLLIDEKKCDYVYVPSKEELGRSAGINVPTSAVSIVEAGDAKKQLEDVVKKIAEHKK